MADFEDFQKLDIRVGTVTEVDEFLEARKPSYKLTIDFGPDIGSKQSSAQLVKHYQRDELVGQKVLGVVNLAPRQIGPFTSEVLTLGVPDADGECVLISPNRDAAAIGGRLY